jgi:uncharacterized short protein YbdD (DUF466 family)
MQSRIVAFAAGALMLSICASIPAAAQTAQQSRMKSCAEEWRGLKAQNQTAGRSYRDFQKECLAKHEPAPTNVGSTTPPAAGSRTAQESRMSACAQEWQAAKRANQTAGRTYREFQRECLSKNEPAAPSTTGSAQQPAPAPLPRAPARSRTSLPSATAGAATPDEAQRSCPSDDVVWANTATKVYHFSSSKRYGHTKHGAYMCRSESDRAGYRAARNEKPPAGR